MGEGACYCRGEKDDGIMILLVWARSSSPPPGGGQIYPAVDADGLGAVLGPLLAPDQALAHRLERRLVVHHPHVERVAVVKQISGRALRAAAHSAINLMPTQSNSLSLMADDFALALDD